MSWTSFFESLPPVSGPDPLVESVFLVRQSSTHLPRVAKWNPDRSGFHISWAPFTSGKAGMQRIFKTLEDLQSGGWTWLALPGYSHVIQG